MFASQKKIFQKKEKEKKSTNKYEYIKYQIIMDEWMNNELFEIAKQLKTTRVDIIRRAFAMFHQALHSDEVVFVQNGEEERIKIPKD